MKIEELSPSFLIQERLHVRLKRDENLSAIREARMNQIQKEAPSEAQGNPPSYAELVCTEKDKHLIGELTSTLAQHNRLWFVLHAGEIKKKVEIFKNRVHILKMLEAIFTNPKLKHDIIKIYKDSTKWNAVIKETKKKMHKMEKKGLLHTYTDDFASAIGAPLEEIRNLFLNRDWEGLSNYLVKRIK